MKKKVSKEELVNKNKESDYSKMLKLAEIKERYRTNKIAGNYHLARYNMIAEQLKNKKILESIDGNLKTEEYVWAEAAMEKMTAIRRMRDAYFAKKELVDDYNFSEEDTQKVLEDYYSGKIIRDNYDGEVQKFNKAGFVKEK